MSPKQDRARYVSPSVDDARLAAQWEHISSRIVRRAPFKRWVISGGVVTAAAALAAVVWPLGWSTPIATEGIALEAGAERQAFRFLDGSRGEMSARARVQVAASRREVIRLLLVRGAVALDVMHVPGRRFIVSAAEVDVVVRGTRFRVELSQGAHANVRVTVERGSVDVRRRGAAGPGHQLSAGNSWSVPASSFKASLSPSDARSTKDGAAWRAATNGAAVKPSFPPPSNETGPKHLLELAEAARRDGRRHQAAALLEALRKRFPGDSRAGLASFELARLRLDAFGDPAGALAALDDALASSPTAPFREDAEARRVEALEALGDNVRCAKARDAYLARYPHGVHRGIVARRCKRK